MDDKRETFIGARCQTCAYGQMPRWATKWDVRVVVAFTSQRTRRRPIRDRQGILLRCGRRPEQQPAARGRSGDDAEARPDWRLLLSLDRSEPLTLELVDACINRPKQQCERQLQPRRQVGFRVSFPPG